MLMSRDRGRVCLENVEDVIFGFEMEMDFLLCLIKVGVEDVIFIV